jgi:hypothetical protein
MNATPPAETAREIAHGLSIFEIDESLEALVEAAEADADANNGEVSENIKSALAAYAEAFGCKVGRSHRQDCASCPVFPSPGVT